MHAHPLLHSSNLSLNGEKDRLLTDDDLAFHRYWLIFELLWRDYFTYLGPKYGSAFFREEGFNGVSRPGANKGIKWKYCGKGEDGEKPLQRWRDGRTGVA